MSGVEDFWNSITDTVKVDTAPCFLCGKSGQVEMLVHHYLEWQNGGLINMVCPEMPAEQREMLISGTHPECWNTLYENDEEEG